MARFRANAQGEITQFMATYQQEKQNATPPPGTVYEQAFDEATNPGLVAAYNAPGGSATFRLDGGTLTQNGTPATINPPGAFYGAFQNLVALKAKRDGGPHTWTTEELDQLFGVAFRGAGLE